MDSKIFGNLNTYYEVYVALSKRSLSKENLVRNLRDAGKIASSASEYGKKAVNGEIAFISGTEEKLELDQAALMQFLLEACGDFNLEAEIHPKRKKKEEDEYGPVKSGHSQNFTNMNNQLNAATAKIKKQEETIAKLTTQLVEAQQDKQKVISAAITAEMDKKVLVPKTISSEPVEVLAKDFFYDNPGKELDAVHLVSKLGGVLDGIYQFTGDMPPEISEKSYLQRICARFRGGELFKKRLDDQTKLGKKQKEVRSLDANRIKSINMLLADEDMDNQTKLSTYAFWYFHDDPQMEELLVFAGEHGINANYVIQLFEKPAEYRNYRTMRAFLMQVQMASEAHIKREAAQELLCGEWSVVADYCGKPCHFKMMPVEELENFKKLLEENKIPKALTTLKKILKSTSGPMDQKLVDEKKEAGCEADIEIEVPSFIHSMDGDVDIHALVEDSSMDDFAEQELDDEQKEGETNE